MAGRLRFLLADIETQNSTLRTATAVLISHMEGLMRQVARRLSHSGTYGRKGYVETVPTVVSAVDLLLPSTLSFLTLPHQEHP